MSITSPKCRACFCRSLQDHEVASDFSASLLVSSTCIHTYIHTYLPLGETHEVNEYYVWRAFCALIGHVDSLGLPVSWVVVHRTGQGHHCFLLLVGNEVKISHGIASRLPRQFRFAACLPATASQSATTCVCEYSIR